MSRRRLTALIPAHNDDYTLALCLRSCLPWFDEVIVLDDCSTDRTPDVACDLARVNRHLHYVRHEGDRQLGWVAARNRLLELAQSDWVFFLDADDILAEYAGPRLREIAEGRNPHVRLGLTEVWGDPDHTTQRLRHEDRCHCFLDRARLPQARWGGCAAARPEFGARAVPGPWPMLFHCKGLKPDRRLVERMALRGWLRSGAGGRCEDYAGLDGLSADDLHQAALGFILRSRIDRITRSYRDGVALDGAPARPAVLTGDPDARRFEMLTRDGRPYERVDHGWSYGGGDDA